MGRCTCISDTFGLRGKTRKYGGEGLDRLCRGVYIVMDKIGGGGVVRGIVSNGMCVCCVYMLFIFI